MIESEDLRTIVDLGFVAFTRGMYDEATSIFEAVRAVRPSDEAGFIGSALMHLQKGDGRTAVQILRSAPPSDSARTFLAMALVRHGDNAEAEAVLQDVIQTGREPAAVDLARQLLEGMTKQDRLPLPR